MVDRRDVMEEGAAMVNIQPISCRDVWQQISNFIEDDVDSNLRARLEAHFKECQHCLAIFDGTRNVVALVGDGVSFEVPSGFGRRLYSRLKQELK